jgi:glycosyltransferase involved in cell wall biosynthesis
VHGVVVDELATHRRQRDRTRAQLGAADDDVVVLTLSNYRTQKGYDTLFEAARHTLDAAPRVRFFAAGQGPRRDEVERWHASYAFGSAFTLLGYRDDTANLLAAADVFVQASTSEGLPVAVMEALALGVPVVATRVGGVPEIVRTGVEGLLVPASDPTALADALLRLVTDPVLRETMSAAAAKRASVVDIATAARRYEECYAEVGRDR